MNPLMGNRKKNNLPHWYRSTVSQVDVMRDGTQVRKTPRSITIWTRDVIRLSNPSRTVFGSSPTLTTIGSKMRRLISVERRGARVHTKDR